MAATSHTVPVTYPHDLPTPEDPWAITTPVPTPDHLQPVVFESEAEPAPKKPLIFGGEIIPPPTNEPESYDDVPQQAMHSGTGWALGIAIVVVLAAVGVIVGLSLGHADRVVRGACRDAVKAQLSSPTTAKFSNEIVDRHGDQATVTGELDAQNDSGAMTHGFYHCDAKQSAGTWTATTTVDGF